MDTSRRSRSRRQSHQNAGEAFPLKRVFIFFSLILVLSPAFTPLFHFTLLSLSSSVPGALICEASGVIVRVVDGDTVDVKVDSTCVEKYKSYVGSVIRVRFADVNAPELSTREGVEAKNFLIETISKHGNKVCLDVDDRRVVDPYNRVIAVVYLKFNETHWLNLNLYIVENGHAQIRDFKDNEFNPETWRLYMVLVNCGDSTTSVTHDLTEPILELLKHWIPLVLIIAVAVLLVVLAASNPRTVSRPRKTYKNLGWVVPQPCGSLWLLATPRRGHEHPSSPTAQSSHPAPHKMKNLIKTLYRPNASKQLYTLL